MKNSITFNNLDNTMNDRIYERNIPSNNLEPNFSSIGLSTRYSKFLVDNTNKYNNIKSDFQSYNTNKTFFPGTSKPHFSGFSSQIDNESILRNQIYPLIKSDLHVWAPDSTSMLYNKTENINNKSDSLLFNEETFNEFNPNVNNKIGSDFFYNSTRVQLKNL